MNVFIAYLKLLQSDFEYFFNALNQEERISLGKRGREEYLCFMNTIYEKTRLSLEEQEVLTDLINKLLPYGSSATYFNMQGITKDKEPARVVKVEGAKLTSADLNSLTSEGYARNAMPFNCKAVKFE